MKIESLNYAPKSNNAFDKDNSVKVEKVKQPLQKVDIENLTPQELNLMSVSERTVIDAIEKANKITLNHNTRAEFSVHEVTKDIMIKIIDNDKNEVIREFPPKKFLDLVAKLWDLAGIVVDERR